MTIPTTVVPSSAPGLLAPRNYFDRIVIISLDGQKPMCQNSRRARKHCHALIFGLMLFPCLILAQDSSRADALERLDRNIAKVRLEMNPSPIDATQRLLEMATSAGDDPRVLAICGEVIRTSTNTISRRGAVDALKAAMSLHGIAIRMRGRTADVSRGFEAALTAKDTQLRLEAIEGYISLGGKQRRRAESLYALALKDIPANTDDGTKATLVRTIRPLLASKDAQLSSSIKQAVTRADLVAFVKNKIGDPILAGSKDEDQKLLRQLEAVAGRK